MQLSYFAWDTANGNGRLKQIKAGTVASPTSLLDLRYYTGTNTPEYDRGRQYQENLRLCKMGSPQTQTFTYDNLDRLTSAQASGGTNGIYATETYTYTATTGNLYSKAGVTYTYGDSDHAHAVTSLSNGNTYGYDSNGNQTSRAISGTAYALSYDADNRLVKVTWSVSNKMEFTYDGDGNRVKSVLNTSTTTTFVGTYYEVTGSAITKYYYTDTSRVAMRTSSGVRYIFGDHLGSTSITADIYGTNSIRQLYKAWGEVRYSSGSLPTKYQFTGQYSETYINLLWYGSRWFDPELGRWIQPDSIVPEYVQGIQAWNRFAYANNNPLAYTDPSGHVAWFVTGAIGAAIGGIIGGALYYAKNRTSFDRGEFGVAAGAGAIAGGLIGSGVGLLAAPATSAALAMAATAITGAGTGAAGSAVGYTVTNQDTFDTTSFMETTAIGGAVGGISAVTPVNGLGVALKAATYIAGSESLYALQTDNWTVEGAQQAAISGAIGAAFDVVGTLAVQTIGTQILSGVYPTNGPQGYLPPKGNQDILKVAARYRSGTSSINVGTGIVSGIGSSLTSWFLSQQVKAE